MTPELASVVVRNPLQAEAEWLRSSPDDVLYIDRHVLDVIEGAASSAVRDAAIAAAFELARSWAQVGRSLIAEGLFVSAPVVIVDEDWLLRADHATPPHVAICLATNERAFEPVDHFARARSATETGHPVLDALLERATRVGLIDSEDAEIPGCWIMRVDG